MSVQFCTKYPGKYLIHSTSLSPWSHQPLKLHWESYSDVSSPHSAWIQCAVEAEELGNMGIGGILKLAIIQSQIK